MSGTSATIQRFRRERADCFACWLANWFWFWVSAGGSRGVLIRPCSVVDSSMKGCSARVVVSSLACDDTEPTRSHPASTTAIIRYLILFFTTPLGALLNIVCRGRRSQERLQADTHSQRANIPGHTPSRSVPCCDAHWPVCLGPRTRMPPPTIE